MVAMLQSTPYGAEYIPEDEPGSKSTIISMDFSKVASRNPNMEKNKNQELLTEEEKRQVLLRVMEKTIEALYRVKNQQQVLINNMFYTPIRLIGIFRTISSDAGIGRLDRLTMHCGGILCIAPSLAVELNDALIMLIKDGQKELADNLAKALINEFPDYARMLEC